MRQNHTPVREVLAGWPEVLRTGDVQEILGVGRKEVYRLIAAGALPAVRAGRGYRILKAGSAPGSFCLQKFGCIARRSNRFAPARSKSRSRQGP